MYFVVDDTQLGSEDGYEEYTVGAAASVPWAGVTNKPEKFTPDTHTHDIDDVTGLQNAIDAKQDAADALKLGTTSTTAYQGDLGKKAYDHSQTKHAPSDAEKNVIVGVQKNGEDITPDTSSRKVNIEVPTKTSELTNDSNYVIVSVGAVSPAGAPKNSLWFKTEA